MLNAPKPSVVVIFDDHWLFGTVENGGIRVLDVLKGGSSDFLRLQDAQLFREADRQTCLSRFTEVVIPKTRIALVLIPSDQHEAPHKRMNTRVEKRLTRVTYVVDGYSVSGEIHLGGHRDDAIYTLIGETGAFFPVTNGLVQCPAGDSITAPVVIANKSHVNCFCLGTSQVEQPLPDLAELAST